jgi:hypothetical protein
MDMVLPPPSGWFRISRFAACDEFATESVSRIAGSGCFVGAMSAGTTILWLTLVMYMRITAERSERSFEE